jgi:Uma2 family endonuclease
MSRGLAYNFKAGSFKLNAMSSVPKYTPHYTIQDYQHWEGDWELWNGIAVSMSPSPYGKHSSLLVRTATAFELAVESAGCKASTLAGIDWIVTRDTILRPDILVVCGPPPQKHVVETPAVVVEILSASTRERDLTVKRRLYQQHAIAWYLIIDPEASTMEVLNLDKFGVYQSLPKQNEVDITICDDCHLKVDVARILR